MGKYIIDHDLMEAEFVANSLLKNADAVNYLGMELFGVEGITVSENFEDNFISVILNITDGQYASIDYYPNEAECRLSTITINGIKYLNIFVETFGCTRE